MPSTRFRLPKPSSNHPSNSLTYCEAVLFAFFQVLCYNKYIIFFERMVHLMAYTIVHNNPLIDANLMAPDVIVSYDANKDRFSVTFVATNTGYCVNRGELIAEDFKYMDAIIREILNGCETDDELDIVFTNRADNEIHMIWEANCDLF